MLFKEKGNKNNQRFSIISTRYQINRKYKMTAQVLSY